MEFQVNGLQNFLFIKLADAVGTKPKTKTKREGMELVEFEWIHCSNLERSRDAKWKEFASLFRNRNRTTKTKNGTLFFFSF